VLLHGSHVADAFAPLLKEPVVCTKNSDSNVEVMKSTEESM